jgi:DNA primase
MSKNDDALIVDLLLNIFGEPHNHNDLRGQISFDCPVCSYDIKGLDHGDGKGNLEINYTQQVYKCWVCSETHGTHGHLGKIIEKYGSKSDIQMYDVIRPDEYTKDDRKYKKLELPKEYNRILDVSDKYPPRQQAYNYLKKRGVTEEIIKKYDIGFATDGEYGGRIIVPSYDLSGKLNYFVGRSYNPRARNKYKNPEAPKELLIFNESRINWFEDIWLVEGVFDSFFVNNSIPLLGKILSDTLWETLYEKALSDIIVCLDSDAWEDAKRIFSKLNGGKLYGKIKIVKLPDGKDLGDLRGQICNEYFVELVK